MVHLCFQYSPKSFHWSIIDTFPFPGHALYHACCMELQPEAFTGVLKPSVAVNQGMCIGIFLQGEIKGCKYEMIVVAPSYGIGNDIIGFRSRMALR